MVRIRLARFGSKKVPYYRIVAAHGESRRDGRFLEQLGSYSPLGEAPIVLDRVRYDHWVSVGAQPSDTVKSIVKRMDKAGAKAGATNASAPTAAA